MHLTLVVLAAGLGSRYGSLKQLDSVGPAGETILDYAIFDALRSGFIRIISVIRHEFETAFRAMVGSKYEGRCEVAYAFQALGDLPAGWILPLSRRKPWGTGHAVWCARSLLNGPFSVINADDFYGQESFEKLADFPRRSEEIASMHLGFAMVGFPLANTLSENGTVARGICVIAADGMLQSVVERTGIWREGVGAGQMFTGNEIVSMNCRAFTPALLPALELRLAEYLRSSGSNDQSECFLPTAVSAKIAARDVNVRVLQVNAAWFGITYRGDKPHATATIGELVALGEYPLRLQPIVAASCR